MRSFSEMGIDIREAYVITSYILAALGLFLSSHVFSKGVSDNGTGKIPFLIVLAGVIAGTTLWTTHFMWMLGFDFEFEHRYAMVPTVVSLALSILFCLVGMFVMSLQFTVPVRAAGGGIVGIGMFAMHYIGIKSLNFGGHTIFDFSSMSATFITSTFLTAMAMAWRVVMERLQPRFVATAIILTALFLLHKIGFQGIEFQPGDGSYSPTDIDDSILFGFVAAVGFFLFMIFLAVVLTEFYSNKQEISREADRRLKDSLTQLGNRAKLEEYLSTNAVGKEKPFVIVNFDLNRFKEINEVHGHAGGDFVLRKLAGNLNSKLLRDEHIFRTGGDEFVAIKLNAETKTAAMEFAKRIRDAVTVDISYEDAIVSVGTSLGISIYPQDGDRAEELLGKANLALSRAKRNRDGIPRIYTAETDELDRAMSAISIDLRKAIENDELKLYYQRQEDITSGRLACYEVLVRWEHPTRGIVGPDVFIPIAERDGMIIEIGEWVLMKACEEAANWAFPAKIAVNVAAKQLSNNNLPTRVQEALSKSGLPASRLELEITESGIIADMEHARNVVVQLKRLGVTIAMDDFGTGNSSLTYLRKFPFDKIKIDKNFVRNITEDKIAQAVVKATIMIGQALGMSVLAEGVESKEELDYLRKEGCTHVQGYLLGRPIPADNLSTRPAA